MGEMPFQVIVDTLSHNAFHMVEEQVGWWLLLQVFHHFPVAAGLGLELRLSSRVGEGTTVKDEPSAVTAEVIGIALLERESVDGDGELRPER